MISSRIRLARTIRRFWTDVRKSSLDAKRLTGRRFNDPTVQLDVKHWLFKVIQGEGARPKIQVEVKGKMKA
uniref:Uncharacterized protein n=1 Tax=Meloidogyne enterolobii TaxID=390850 RepID=A0A6V7XTG6_MELEN|nr:unnamed protein product [Meloidogyne enterolobii]